MKNLSKGRLEGFTLMELLVVVLVIGVLAAVAVPQYQRSVDKSRYSTLMPVAASVRNAQETFYMASAAYSPDLSGLDVSLPGEVHGSRAELGNGVNVEVSAENGNGFVSASKEGLDNKYVMYFANSANFPKEVHCEALSSSDRAKKLCTGLGGRELGAAGNYTKYVLEGAGAGSLSEAESGGSDTSSGGETESPLPSEGKTYTISDMDPQFQALWQVSFKGSGDTMEDDFLYWDGQTESMRSNIKLVDPYTVHYMDSDGNVRESIIYDPSQRSITTRSSDGSVRVEYFTPEGYHDWERMGV